MRNKHKSIIYLLTLLSVLVFGLCVSACNPKDDGNRITLTFVTNGGSTVSSLKTEKNVEVTLPETTKSGYDFIGWHYAEDLSDAALTGTIIAPEESATLYAEWAETGTTHLVTLDLEGGTLVGSSLVIRVKTGDNLYNAVKNIVPVKGDLEFGAWFYEGEQVKSSHTMPDNDITLTAKYRVTYTLQIFTLNVSGMNYTLDLEHTKTGSDFVGTNVTPIPPTVEHFTYTETPTLDGFTAVNTITLGENASENILKLYYSRVSYPITFDANLPENVAVSGSMSKASMVYGGLYVFPENNFKASGYRFVGWNTDGSNIPLDASNIRIDGPTTVYAVWDKGFVDRFSSEDYVFFPRNEAGVAILERGGYEFRGTRNGNDFEFTLPSGEKLEGRVYNDTYFALARENLEGVYYGYNFDYNPEHQIDDRVDENVSLVVNEFLDAEYTDKNSVLHNGSLLFDREMGDYIFTSDDGSLSFHTILIEDYEGQKVFSIASEKEQNAYIELMMVGNMPYVIAQYNLVLDGYGNIFLYANLGGYGFTFSGNYYIANELIIDGVTLFKVVAEIEDGMGLLTPNAEPGIVSQIFYTIPFAMNGEMFAGYIAADVYEGRYKGEGDMSLILDGLGIFDDSAVYVDEDGAEHKGTYVINRTFIDGIIVDFQAYDEEEIIKLKISVTYGTVELFDESNVRRTEYSLMTDSFDFPLLVIYDEEKVTVGTEEYAKAELYTTDNGGDNLMLATEGYITQEELGIGFNVDGELDSFYLYTFVVQNAIDKAHPGIVPKESMKFFMTAANSVEDNSIRDGYVVMEIDGEKRYTEYLLEDGGKIWGNTNVTITGLGSLYFMDSDLIFEGSFTKAYDSDFSYDYITFIYFDGYETITDVYELDSANPAVKHNGQKMSLNTLAINEDTNMQFYATNIIIDGNIVDMDDGNGNTVRRGRARYCDLYNYTQQYVSGGTDYQWQDATYEEHLKASRFGYDYFTLYVGKDKLFDFAIYLTQDAYGQIVPLYFTYDYEADGEYLGNDGSRLALDGYYWAEYTNADGRTYNGPYDINGDLVYLTLENGYDTYLKLTEGGGFFILDYSYGIYDLLDINYADFNTGNNEIFETSISFDGQGGVTVTWPDGSEKTGTYSLTDESTREYIVNANFALDKQMPQGGWRVRLMSVNGYNICVVYDGSTEGTFYNDNWDVIYLDGFGSGSLYTSDGTMAGTGYYTIVNADKGFMIFTFEETMEDAFIIFDFETEKFEIQSYKEFHDLYVAEDLDYIALTDTAEIRLGSIWSGQYFYDDNYIYAYVTDWQSDFRLEQLERPRGDTYVYKGKTYYKVTNNHFALDGQVVFYGEDGKDDIKSTLDVTLKFDMNIGGNYNTPAKITIEEKEYDFVLNIYTNGICNPRITYNGVDYDIDFSFVNGNSAERTFTIGAGYREVEMNNYNDAFRDNAEGYPLGGVITKKIIGFGPYNLSDAVYDGKFGFQNTNGRNVSKTPIEFSDIPEEDVLEIGYRYGGLGNLYEITFKDKNNPDSNTLYAIDFYEYSSQDQGAIFVLQGFYKYEELQYNGYKAYVKYLIYANFGNTPGYAEGVNAFDKPYGVTLFKPDGTPVYLYDTNVTINHDGVWIGEMKGTDTSGNIVLGDGYLINFTFGDDSDTNKVTAITVETYKIGQLVSMGYLINFFVDKEDGHIVTITSVAYSYEGSYIYLSETKDLEEIETNVWTFVGTPPAGTETHYTFDFEVSESIGPDGQKVFSYEVTISAE